MHALDPQSIPIEAAVKSAKVVVDRLLDRQMRDNNGQYPETIACVEVGSRHQKWTCPDLCRFYRAEKEIQFSQPPTLKNSGKISRVGRRI